MKILVVYGDLSGCRYYRVTQPFAELKRFDLEWDEYCYLPSDPLLHYGENLVKWVSQYDLVILQRCYKYQIAKLLKEACAILGKKLIFETDDDYLHIPMYNPCSKELNKPEVRVGFIEILKMADLITVSTEELKMLYYPYNKNIVVIPNNIKKVHYYKDIDVGIPDEKGAVEFKNTFGFVNVPKYIKIGPNKLQRNIRIMYTGTPTHQFDFKTIQYHFFRAIKKFKKQLTCIWIGDRYFFDLYQQEMAGESCNVAYIPHTQDYDLYYLNVRCGDIGIAPLVPDIFNMSKSPIKAIEYGSWGIPSILPHYVTYTREFTPNKNCLTYYSGNEFYDALCTLIENETLREDLGNAAREHIKENRLEANHALARYRLYQDFFDKQPKHQVFTPNKCAV